MKMYWSDGDGLVIETKHGTSKIYYRDGEGLTIENEDAIIKSGMSIDTALAAYFDRTTGKAKDLYKGLAERVKRV